MRGHTDIKRRWELLFYGSCVFAILCFLVGLGLPELSKWLNGLICACCVTMAWIGHNKLLVKPDDGPDDRVGGAG